MIVWGRWVGGGLYVWEKGVGGGSDCVWGMIVLGMCRGDCLGERLTLTHVRFGAFLIM